MNSLVKVHIALSVVGLAVSSYLFSVKILNIEAVCGISTCGVVNRSEYSMLLGIPISAWGMLYYFAMAVVGLELNNIHQTRRPLVSMLVGLFQKANSGSTLYYRHFHDLNIFLSAVGVLFSIYLIYLEVFVIYAWCQWCAVSAWVALCLFILSIRIYRLRM